MSGRLAWVTGATGLIGGYIVRAAPQLAPEWRATGLTRAELDLLDIGAVRAAFRGQRPQLVIHCAALSKSPECEAQPDLARRLNVEVTALLAELAAAVPFLFLSTDLVFDGSKGNYGEGDAVNPLRDWQGAPRPPDTSLDCARAQAILSFPLPRLSDWLAAHPDEYF